MTTRRHVPSRPVIGLSWIAVALMTTMPARGGDAPKPGDVFWDCSACPAMVVVPAGVFAMGASFAEGGDDEMPIHKVRIPHAFAIGRYEVTRGEFKAFVAASGYEVDGPCKVLGKNDWEESGGTTYRAPSIPQSDEHPVVCVNWFDAKAYVAWLSRTTRKAYHLPSEAEWEYAARAGSSTLYFFGTAQKDICSFGNGSDAHFPYKWRNDTCDDGYGWGTAPVGKFRPNRFGLYDTIGNAWEWVEDCWNDSYEGAPVDGTPWLTGECTERGVRGGSWLSEPRFLRSATRFRSYAGYRFYDYGFRVARSLAE